MEKKYGLSEFGYKAVIGAYAQQADSSVWLEQGGTVVLATVVSATSEDFPGFLPLSVEYREQLAAAGKIPGGYIKREGRPTENEILSARLIDRSVRPLFSENFFDRVQLNTTVYSVDRDHTPQNIAFVAASLALSLAPVPFLGPVGICEVARVNGEWIYNPTFPQAQESDVKIVVAGTKEGVNMVEGSAAEISEDEFLTVMFKAHEYIKKQVVWQEEVCSDYGVQEPSTQDTFDWSFWQERARAFLTQERIAPFFSPDKEQRSSCEKRLQQEFIQQCEEEQPDASSSTSARWSYVFDKMFKEAVNERVFQHGSRLDGRDFETVRPITTRVGLLPFNHGSAMFQRGQTQALVSTTLGGGQDQARSEGLFEDASSAFMLHYNFPPFSVGEVRPYRGPGRREIGHGHLAASAIERVIPDQEEFPYTIRVVSDILGSDGSSSMATVCGATMSLMDAGAPIKRMVSGVAMGLLRNADGDFRVLTDILGQEDAIGLMDFKVAGTDRGITAIQMDLKYKGGLPRDVLKRALEQAHRGRMHILQEMQSVLNEPKKELSELVPRVISFKVPQDKIGAIIGAGGKVVRDIIEKTNTSVDIEDDGTVKVFGHPGGSFDQAISWIKILAGEINEGDTYKGTVTRKEEYGVFVEIAPGVTGLVHVSTVPRSEQKEFFSGFSINDEVLVQVMDYDASTGRIRLKIVENKS